MKNNKGITMIIVIIIVIILSILVGVITFGLEDTYEKSTVIQFSSYMKMIQKKVDFYVEDGVDCTTLGQNLNSENKLKLQEILDSDFEDLISTTDVNNSKIRYFNSSDIYDDFDIADINDEIIVNFENREVISLKGVEKEGMKYHVEKGL